MSRFISIVEMTAGWFLAALAVITFAEAVLRYGFQSHIPDGFVIGQTMQGIAICWGIATATYADRHIRVDILYEAANDRIRRGFDITAYTVHLLFAALFAAAMTYKVYDMSSTGEISTELRIPLWIGYTVAAAGILAAFVTAFLRWAQIVFGHRASAAEGPSHNV